MTIFLTPEGRSRVEQTITELEARLAELLLEKAEAAELGGNQWHDNFSFEQLERDERDLRRRMATLRDRVARARDAPPPGREDTADIGSTVEVHLAGKGTRTVTLVGHGESDPASGSVAYDAPLGAAVLGARVGERRQLRVGSRSSAVTVLRITKRRE